MINVGTLSKLRRLVLRDKVSIRQASRQLGISRNTATRWLQEAEVTVPRYPKRQPTFGVLDPFKETSLIAEVFTEKFGRIPVVAKGARRPRSSIRGMLQSFQILLANWSGKSELKSLNGLEWCEKLTILEGDALMCGFYINKYLLPLFSYYAEKLAPVGKMLKSITMNSAVLVG